MTKVTYDYSGTRVVVTGAASGMGRATAELLVAAGASVISLDVAPCAVGEAVRVDLGDPASIDAAIAAIGSPVDALFNCAGVPHGPRFDPVDVVTVNFLGHRRLTEGLVPAMAPGSAVVSVSSVAGERWREFAAELEELMGIDDWDEARTWLAAHPELVSVKNCYNASKQALVYWTMWRCASLARLGIRINSTGPGPTETGMTPLFHEANGPQFYENLRQRLGRNAEPEEQAHPLLFLNSAAASYISGTNLYTDNGMTAMLWTNQLHRDELRQPAPAS